MYYPKSKIVENQHTSGGELTDPLTGNSYAGFYHITYDGNFYTGASHSINSQPLTGAVASSGSGSFDTLSHLPYMANLDYDNASNSKMSYLFSFEIPEPIYPQPNTMDYQAGQFTRYFMQLVTNKKISEIQQAGFQSVQSNPLYNNISLVWKLTGPVHDTIINQYTTIYGVADTNARTLGNIENNMKGISRYLRNLIELAQIQ